MKKILFIFLISCFVGYGQNSNTNKEKDTIYVFFKNKNIEKYKAKETYRIRKHHYGMWHTYAFNLRKKGYSFIFSFFSNDKGEKFVSKGVPQSILKKEKKLFYKEKKIIKYRDLKKMSHYERSKLGMKFFNSVVYLIDKDETTKKEIILREVKTYNSIPILQ